MVSAKSSKKYTSKMGQYTGKSVARVTVEKRARTQARVAEYQNLNSACQL
jgi:hypothetical protein